VSLAKILAMPNFRHYRVNSALAIEINKNQQCAYAINETLVMTKLRANGRTPLERLPVWRTSQRVSRPFAALYRPWLIVG
jgi:hypothetical protein